MHMQQLGFLKKNMPGGSIIVEIHRMKLCKWRQISAPCMEK